MRKLDIFMDRDYCGMQSILGWLQWDLIQLPAYLFQKDIEYGNPEAVKNHGPRVTPTGPLTVTLG